MPRKTIITHAGTNYEDLAAMPIGTVIADRESYWEAIRRHHVKTTRNTWAVFFHLPTEAEVRKAVVERRNNVSPGPLGILAVVTLPAQVSAS